MGRPPCTRLAVAVPRILQEFTILLAGEEHGGHGPGDPPSLSRSLLGTK